MPYHMRRDATRESTFHTHFVMRSCHLLRSYAADQQQISSRPNPPSSPHIAEPVVGIFARHLDLSAPRPPADHREAAQQPNNRRGHGDGEDADGAATGAVMRAWRLL